MRIPWVPDFKISQNFQRNFSLTCLRKFNQRRFTTWTISVEDKSWARWKQNVYSIFSKLNQVQIMWFLKKWYLWVIHIMERLKHEVRFNAWIIFLKMWQFLLNSIFDETIFNFFQCKQFCYVDVVLDTVKADECAPFDIHTWIKWNRTKSFLCSYLYECTST